MKIVTIDPAGSVVTGALRPQVSESDSSRFELYESRGFWRSFGSTTNRVRGWEKSVFSFQFSVFSFQFSGCRVQGAES